jgi:GR25 family glycosyltransferase involved in LPS biosynthesis
MRDAGQNEAALAEYSKRAKMGHWQQEVYLSLYNVAKIKEELHYPVEQVIGAYEEATKALGSRAEALHDAARFCRNKKLFERGYEFARRGLAIKYPKDALFVVDWIYDYGLLDQSAINAYWCGKYAQCMEACHRLLTEGKLPADQHERVEKNRRFAQDKLSEGSDAGLDEYAQALRVARAKEETAQIIEDVLEAYATTQTIDPERAEALHGAARYCRNKGVYERGYLLAMQGRCLPFPTRAPERERWIYDYGLLDELAVNAYWSEHYADCIAACDQLLSSGKLPNSERPRILKNKQFAEDKLKEINAAGCPEPDTFVRLLRTAREKERIQAANEEVVQAYRGAVGADPSRAEAWHGLARYFRNQGMHQEGYEAAKQGLIIPKPMRAPFLEGLIYDYGLLDELAINAYWAEKYEESATASRKMLKDGKIPSEQIGRIKENLEHALRKRDLGFSPLESIAFRESSDLVDAEVGIAHREQGATSSLQTAEPMIPRTFHFITGLDENFGGKPFSFIHFMAIRSALRLNHGFRAKVYYHHEPSGKYWNAIKGDVELVRVDLPTEVFGNPVEHFAHKADVLRLQILLKYGGIYLDLDTICQRPFEQLLDGRVVMGLEERGGNEGSRKTEGLCNATIIAPPNADFLRLWYETYRDFTGGTSGDKWNKFSVQIPMALARKRPELLRIEPATSFFWPSWDRVGLDSLFSKDCEFPDAYSFHLWESQSWPYVKDLDESAVRQVDTTYNKLARRFLDLDDFTIMLRHSFFDEQQLSHLQIHVINLARDHERREKFLSLNAHLPKIVRPPAIEGRQLDRDMLERMGYISPPLSYNNAVLGNAHSHIELWRKAAESGEPVTVAEDDAIFAQNFLSASSEVLSKVDADWDIMLWGWNFDALLWLEIPEGVSACKLVCNQEEMRQNIETFRSRNSSPTPLRLRHSFGIMGYTISPTGAKSMMEICLPLQNTLIPFEGYGVVIENKTIDAIMNKAYPRLKAYVCMPPLVVSENWHETTHTWSDR